MQKRRTCLQKLQRFHFLLFSRTTSKKPSRLTWNFQIQYRRLSSDSNEDRKITFSIENHKISPFLDVYGIFGPKWHPEIHKRELGSPFLARGGPRRARPARRASLAASAGLASRRASLAAHGPAGCDPQVLQLAVGSGRGGEGGGRADNSPAPHSYHRRWVIWYIGNMKGL